MGVFDDMLEDLFDEDVSVEATYNPQGEDPFSVSVVPTVSDQIDNFGATRIQSDSALFEVRVSEFTAQDVTPTQGDTLTVSGSTYTLKRKPEAFDGLGLMYLLECTPP
jgi:hypothetical protein